MKDFLSFRKMITPIVIQVIFWLGVVGCLITGLISMFGGAFVLIKGDGFGGGRFAGLFPIIIGILWMVVGPIIVRIYCEILILFFRMNDTLTEIKNNTANRVQ
ncbi:MAG TPA: DUF4282 domain-containing protein [Acidobacteriota bacterium]|nr:DUF4282 domain-containing protein [Acidobacteriota bacterium]HNT17125.1 DUF4282 domain-containing protein [Acidobacteriota bacterium]